MKRNKGGITAFSCLEPTDGQKEIIASAIEKRLGYIGVKPFSEDGPFLVTTANLDNYADELLVSVCIENDYSFVNICGGWENIEGKNPREEIKIKNSSLYLYFWDKKSLDVIELFRLGKKHHCAVEAWCINTGKRIQNKEIVDIISRKDR